MAAGELALEGPRMVVRPGEEGFPPALIEVPRPPQALYVIGAPEALHDGLAIVGARKATPYGRSCAMRFARQAAERGIPIISGGARGCDTVAHTAALEAGGLTAVILGGGCDRLYPAENRDLFQRIVDAGGAVASEQPWGMPPKPWMFRERNRIIAGASKATLIVEAGLPSGTFSTADEALAADREVLVVPGAITSAASAGANRLIYQGATPIVDDDSFADQLFAIFGCLRQESAIREEGERQSSEHGQLLAALRSQAMSLDELMALARSAGDRLALPEMMLWLAQQASVGVIAQYPDGRYGPAAPRA